jgi:hypothetical protein
MLEEIRNTFQDSKLLSFLDDITIISKSLQDAENSLKLLQDISTTWGFTINFQKSNFVSVKPISKDDLEIFPLLYQLQLESGITFETAHQGTKIVGGCLGSPEFIQNFMAQQLKALLAKHDAISKLIDHINTPNFQDSNSNPIILNLLQFIRYTLPSQAQYIISTIDPMYTQVFAKTIDNSVANLILKLCHNPNPNWSNTTQTLFDYQATNPDLGTATSMTQLSYERIFQYTAGLGVTSTARATRPAYLGSISASAPFLESFIASPAGLFPNTNVFNLFHGVQHVINLRNRIVTPHLIAQFSKHRIYDPIKPQFQMQKCLSQILRVQYESDIKKKIADPKSTLPPLYIAQFTSSSHKYASSWTYVNLKYLPKPNKFNSGPINPYIGNDASRDNFLLTLGFPPQIPQIAKCWGSSKCKTFFSFVTLQDHTNNYQHIIGCTHHHHTVGAIIEHEAINMCRKSFTYITLQTPYAQHPQFQPTQNCRLINSDVAFIHSSLHQYMFGDVTFTSKLEVTKSHRNKVGFAASKLEKGKVTELKLSYRYPDRYFVGLAFESHGGWGDASTRFFENAFSLLRHAGKAKQREWYFITQKMGLAIRRANGEYLRHFRCLNHATPSPVAAAEEIIQLIQLDLTI